MDFLPHIGDRLAGTDGGKKHFFEIVQSMVDKNSSFFFIEVAKKTHPNRKCSFSLFGRGGGGLKPMSKKIVAKDFSEQKLS